MCNARNKLNTISHPASIDATLVASLYEPVYPKYFKGTHKPNFDVMTTREALIAMQDYDLLRKYQSEASSDKTREAGLAKYMEGEEICFWSNSRFLYQKPWFFRRAKTLASQILGRFSYNEFLAAVRLTNGASARLPRRKSQVVRKVIPIEVTARCFNYGATVIRDLHESSSPGDCWSDLMQPIITDSSTITTVPKNQDTDRPIEKSASLNMMLQLGVGYMIRSRLKAFGININDQGVNQRLCMHGALTGELCTIDLSSASDTICDRLVSEIIPLEWLDKLNKFRHHTSVLPSGEVISLQKFSAMGNGFTFELETLIFACVLMAVTPELNRDNVGKVWHVYGDDMIVPKKYFDKSMLALQDAGFIPNYDKSFRNGPFKESCGVNYHNWLDITPVRLSRALSDSNDIISFYNNTYRYDLRHLTMQRPRFRKVRAMIRRILRERGHLFFGPPCDNISSFCFSNNSKRYITKWCPQTHDVKHRGLVPVNKAKRFDGVTALIGNSIKERYVNRDNTVSYSTCIRENTGPVLNTKAGYKKRFLRVTVES